MITTWRFSCLVKLLISMRHFVLHAYVYTWALEPRGVGGAFFCLSFFFFFWWVVQFFQFASNATVYDLLNDHVLWKKNQTTDPQIPNLNTTGSFVNKFSKKNNAIVLCFWYKIVPWMISLCRTPWKEVQIKTHHIQNYNHRFLLGKYSTTVVVHTVAKKIK